jgi:acetyl esterase/lipase
MVAAFTPIGLAGAMPEAPLDVNSPIEHRMAYCAAAEEVVGGVLDALALAAPAPAGVSTTTVTIAGGDGNEVTLFISRPDHAQGPLPALVHLHGGAMAIGSAADASYRHLREALAAAGLVTVGVEFRNSGGRLGAHPYPAGHNDCAAAIRWVHAHADDLGISHLIVGGESGGGNLSLTVTHKAKREGWLDEIAGVYAQCPYISDRWLDYPDDLPSLRENDGYFISCQQAALLGSIYDPGGEHVEDPTCWAAKASDMDLNGLPPHVISVNELDPLRDEGLAYYRRLLGAGVSAVGRIVAGTCHGGDILLPKAMPDVFESTVADIAGFARLLTPR